MPTPDVVDGRPVDASLQGTLDGKHHNHDGTKNRTKKKKKKGSTTVIDRVVSGIHENDSNVLWVRLNSSRLGDDHMSSLCTALEQNTHVLSLDLSDNRITEKGMKMLCDCLCRGGACDMIELDIRGNAFACRDDVDRMVKHMTDIRKVIQVKVDAANMEKGVGDVDEGATSSSLSSLSASSSESSSESEYSKIVQQVFDVAENNGHDGDSSSSDSDGGSMGVNLEEESAMLWEEVTYCVAKHDATCRTLMHPKLSSSLFSLNEYLNSELLGYKLPLLEDTTLDDLHIFLSSTVSHVHVLDRILDFQVPPAFQTQYHKDVMVPRLGSHRAMAVTLAASALQVDCPCVSEAFSHTRILEKAMRLSIQFPSCSILHSQCLEMARVAVSSHSISTRLWKQLVSSQADVWETLGKILQGLAADCSGYDSGTDRNTLDCANRNASAVSGMLAGFCIKMVQLLHRATTDGGEDGRSSSPSVSTPSVSSDDDDQNHGMTINEYHSRNEEAAAAAAAADVQGAREELKQALEAMPGWAETIPSVHSLLRIQENQLGGPPPPRMSTFDNFNDSMNFSGPQLLALLQGLTLSSSSASSHSPGS